MMLFCAAFEILPWVPEVLFFCREGLGPRVLRYRISVRISNFRRCLKGGGVMRNKRDLCTRIFRQLNGLFCCLHCLVLEVGEGVWENWKVYSQVGDPV